MTQQTHILIIEDDASINEVVTTFLTKKGFLCTQAFSGSEALLLLEKTEESFDLVITDLMLPGASGQELVKRIRQEQHVPIIVTSALDAPEQKVDLLELGADDYLTKPFDLDELYARVVVQLRHQARAQESLASHVTAAGTSSGEGAAQADGDLGTRSAADTTQSAHSTPAEASAHSSDTQTITYRLWTLKPESRQLEAGGKPIKLTRIEYNIIETLMRRPTKVFTKQELFELAWNEECYVEEKAINVHISNIRAKLKESQTHEYIETVWGIGFRLTGG